MSLQTEALHAHPESRWTSEAAWIGTRRPVHEAHALPADCYADKAFFAEEQERVFATSWVCIGLHDELDAPGSAIVRTVGGRSVIVTRNADGDLRAFLNSCRHRGTQLLEDDCTLGSTIRCPYHRWTYDRDGVLVATPHFADADTVERLRERVGEVEVLQEVVPDVGAEVVRVAQERDAELVVVGVRHRSPVGKALMGSVSQRVLLDATCPVLAVKPRG